VDGIVLRTVKGSLGERTTWLVHRARKKGSWVGILRPGSATPLSQKKKKRMIGKCSILTDRLGHPTQERVLLREEIPSGIDPSLHSMCAARLKKSGAGRRLPNEDTMGPHLADFH